MTQYNIPVIHQQSELTHTSILHTACPTSISVPNIGVPQKTPSAPKTLVVSSRYTFPALGKVTSISANIGKASGRLTFYVLRPQDSPVSCNFDVIAEWDTPMLAEVGYQKVGDDRRLLLVLL